MIELMVDDISIKETLDIKEILLSIDGIESVLWLDDVVDVTKPENKLMRLISIGFTRIHILL